MRSLMPAYREFYNPANIDSLLQPIPRNLLNQLAEDFEFDKWARKITFQPYFRMQLLLALTRYQTLSELQEALRRDPLFQRLGARMDVSVSALAQVPGQRGSAVFEEVLDHVLPLVGELPHTARRGRALTTATLRSIQELLTHTQIVDSSTFRLPPAIAKWAETRRNGAGFKLHLRLAAGYGGLAQVEFSPAREHDRPHLDGLAKDAEPGSIFLMDRGYQDYKLFDAWTSRSIFFVSKLRRNHAGEVLEEKSLDQRLTPSGYTLKSEARVSLGSKEPGTHFAYRLLDMIPPGSKEVVTLVTNLWDLEPEQICALYQYRWTIETVFRWLKHTLGLHHLISTNRHGVTIQIVMALLVYALLVIYQEGDTDWSPKRMLVRMHILLNWALVQYGYELAQAGRPPPWEDPDWSLA